jgi:hypothetical protein
MFDSLAVSNLTIHAVDTNGLVNVGPQTNTMIHGARRRIAPEGRSSRPTPPRAAPIVLIV